MKLAITALVVLAVLAAVTLWKARQHEARAEAAFPPRGHVLDVGGETVHARVMGPDDGSVPDLVMIHGASGNLRDFSFDLAPRLAGDFRVILFDRPGLGYTGRIDGDGATITQQAGLLMRAARQLGAARPVVLGHSYGGAVALAWAVHHPDALSALVPLAAASHPWDTGLPTYYKVLSHPLAGPLVIPLLSAYVPDSRVQQAVAEVFTPDPVPRGYLDHFGAGLTLRRHSLRANALQRANLLDEITALAPRYGEISVPTEILHGTADTTVGLSIHSAPLARAIAGATLTRLAETGHMPHHADPRAVIDAVHRATARAGLR
ncbi:MAG: alpha/beta hydrolase [Roseovarius sp.]|nr:alpha/beta hydrolase [Roseovarius sp.]